MISIVAFFSLVVSPRVTVAPQPWRFTNRQLPLRKAHSENEWSALTVADLKEQLRSRGLAVSGKKADLVDRLIGSTPGTIPIPQGGGEDEDAVWDTVDGVEVRRPKLIRKNVAGTKVSQEFEELDAELLGEVGDACLAQL